MKKLPVQVYLDPRDRKLLDELARQHGLSKAEALRSAVRRWAIESKEAEDPVLDLIGSIDERALPPDLSTRHDEYAVFGFPRRGRRGDKKRRGRAR